MPESGSRNCVVDALVGFDQMWLFGMVLSVENEVCGEGGETLRREGKFSACA